MAKTAFLPTVTAVRMVWAITGKFSDDPSSQQMANYVEDTLRHMEEDASAKGANPQEKSYIISVAATMKASLRSLDTAYKGRTLNFEENEKLRAAYLESVKENIAFGNKAQDFLKSLPSMTLTAAGGVTVAQFFHLPDFVLWGGGLALAALGYLINLVFVRRARRETQMQYVIQDYERGLYYDQYVRRVKLILRGLFFDLERIHVQIFKENYESDVSTPAIDTIIKDILTGVDSTFCPFVHKHKDEKKLTPESWARCESGHPGAIEACPYWQGVRNNAPATAKA